MQIDASPTVPTTTLTLPLKAVGNLLRHGAILQATVVDTAPGGRLTLQIGQQLLEARSEAVLALGQRLRLQVEITQSGAVLRTLEPAANPNAPLTRALRNSLPKQASPTELIQHLTRLATPGKAVGTETLPKAVVQMARKILEGLPSERQVATPQGLARAVAASGLLLEAQLFRGQAPATTDLKALLLRLADLLRSQIARSTPTADAPPDPAAATKQPPPSTTPRGGAGGPPESATAPLKQELTELLRQTESGLARIQTHQLTTLTHQRNDQLAWVVELPLRQTPEQEPLRLFIQRDKQADGAGEAARWSVTLELHSLEHGPLHAVVSLSGGKVSATFWAEQTETAERFRDQLPALDKRLQKAGLEIGRLASYIGRPAEPPAARLPGLLDEKA